MEDKEIRKHYRLPPKFPSCSILLCYSRGNIMFGGALRHIPKDGCEGD